MQYTFYWLTGKREVLEGNTPETALNNAGFGQGAVRALDFWAHGDNNDYLWNAETREWNMKPEARERIFGRIFGK
jgi:hypothetical protein